MRSLRRWAGYAALNRPLTVLGVERRLFLLGVTLAVAVWNATASLVAGGVVFAGFYGAGWLAGRKDPAMLAVLRAAARHPARFDPGKWATEPWHLKIRGRGE
ncbi:MAG: VirB3 family type IV secretion system protein [Gemmatimonadota bacterium]|nr:VirB3 family type IV secretion system protein [Gemmatimonadota bacterium]